MKHLFLGEVFERASVLFMSLNGKLDVEAAKELAPGFENKLKNANVNAVGKFEIIIYSSFLLFPTAESNTYLFNFR